MENGFSLSQVSYVLLFIALTGGRVVSAATPEHRPRELVIQNHMDKSLGAYSAQRAIVNRLRTVLPDEAVLKLHPLPTDEAITVVKFATDEAWTRALASLRKDPKIKRVEPNYIFRKEEIPNDPDFLQTWGLSNQGQMDPPGGDESFIPRQYGTVGADIHVLPVWDMGHHGSKDIIVAVIDTGAQWDHPDLAENIYTNPGEAGALANNGLDDDGNGFVDDVHGWNFIKKSPDSRDDEGHGTHVAGTIGAVGNNALGVAGVNWAVSIMPLKFLDSQGSGTLEDAVSAIQYAIKMKARVLSNSWGAEMESDILADAVKATAASGALFVAASGNGGYDGVGDNNDVGVHNPSNVDSPNLLSVAALNNRDHLATFSNYGKSKVHVAAPGVRVWSLALNGAYQELSGTSMATPHVAGAAALLLSVHPEWNYQELKSRLIQSSRMIPGLRTKIVSRGSIDVAAALAGNVTPNDDPDPSAWVDVVHATSSVHPYEINTNQTFQITHPGAKMIRVHFDRLETEPTYDYVSVETPDGAVLDSYSGTLSDVTSEYVQGSEVVIRLKSDHTVNAWGFSVDKVQVIY